MIILKKITLTLSLIALAIGFSTSGAFAACKVFPDYKLWNTLTHDRAISYVDRKLKGDWSPYIGHLRKQISNIEKIIASGKSARLKHKGKVAVLTGENLEEYLQVSHARLDVVQCLANEQDVAKLDKFATAAGDEAEDKEIAVSTKPVAPGSARVKLAVSTSCSNGVSKFRIKNEGADWPKSSSFSLFRIEGAKKYPVSARRMRLKRGQIASFSVKKSRNPSGQLGLFVGPTWYERAFAYDATLTCR
jgi:hypothetical protein